MLHIVKETFQARDESKIDEYGLPAYYTYFICTNPGEGRGKYDMFRVSSLGKMEYEARGCGLTHCRSMIRSRHPHYPKGNSLDGTMGRKIHKIVVNSPKKA